MKFSRTKQEPGRKDRKGFWVGMPVPWNDGGGGIVVICLCGARECVCVCGERVCVCVCVSVWRESVNKPTLPCQAGGGFWKRASLRCLSELRDTVGKVLIIHAAVGERGRRQRDIFFPAEQHRFCKHKAAGRAFVLKLAS